MLVLAGVIGGLSGWVGASISSLLPRLPAGAVIVLVAAGIFALSMAFGTARGVLPRLIAHRRLHRKVGRQHLLRSVYEILEATDPATSSHVANHPISFEQLLDHRSWTRGRLLRLIATARREDHIEFFDGQRLCLSESGFGEAARTTRNHRLWEMYMIQHADLAPGHVDRDADTVEHVLGADMVRQLEVQLTRRGRGLAVPPSPHALPTGAASS
jgi:manganese/zinc/iron transport system permease protein